MYVFLYFYNCREFYYIQMEKYARQAVSEGVKNVEELQVGGDSEIYRVLNLHYNRNNHIEVWGPQVRKITEHAHASFYMISLIIIFATTAIVKLPSASFFLCQSMFYYCCRLYSCVTLARFFNLKYAI